MKKHILISLFAYLFIIISGCNFFQGDNIPIELVAFNSLTKEEQDKILVSPKDSSVKKVTVNDELSEQLGNNLIGKRLYAVIFNGTETDSVGKLIVYVDLNKETVVGKGYEKKTNN
ncbi:hypothetical protein [Metabacillus endolithicus]|uniref:DUF3221 domain-containing protein n=1 Tax=Metabacillus endolithicus TaxID=1535204 RepID=A0ABW5BRA6_9BACI|nr:hypothetical protein [Metabacillus endolithicus]UPG63867.1 hypothetical protein MVE64_01515 [Metabacillus endolithicus]